MSNHLPDGRPIAYLDHFSGRNRLLRRILLDPLPFRVGRGGDSHLVIHTQKLSKDHCEILWEGGTFLLRDLASTNGTYLNGERITESVLCNDDLIQIAHEELRFLVGNIDASLVDTPLTEPLQGEMPASILRGTQYLQEMLTEQAGRVLFQPIIDFKSGEVFGYESLGRGMHANLKIAPGHLFDLADQCGLAVPLSQMFMRQAVREAVQLPPGRHIFLNLHPSEMACPDLLESLRETLLHAPSDRKFVVEINEKAVVELNSLRHVLEKFHDVGLRVAYDDFGTGQARLLELAESPPDFVKLDMSLIRELHLNASRQNLVRAITRASLDLGVAVIAEGIETHQEAEVCQSLGCGFGQGFFFGRPRSASMLTPVKC